MFKISKPGKVISENSISRNLRASVAESVNEWVRLVCTVRKSVGGHAH